MLPSSSSWCAVGLGCCLLPLLGCSLVAGLSDHDLGAASSSSGGLGSSSVWPDSVSHRCSNGTAFVDICPGKDQPTYGQDGSFEIQKPTYAKTTLTAQDSVTGLLWQRIISNNQQYGWTGAAMACKGSLVAGLNTWRLPTRLELISLFDMGRYAPSIDATVIDPADGVEWSSSPAPAGNAWAVHLDVGTESPEAPSTLYYTLCVSGPPMTGSLAARDADTALDSRTGLTWQRATAPDLYTWEDALTYCELENGAAKGDATGWRLPTNKELLTLVDELHTSPAIDATIFPKTDATNSYWTSSPHPSNDYPGTAYAVSFKDGGAERIGCSSLLAVRCVKSGG